METVSNNTVARFADMLAAMGSEHRLQIMRVLLQSLPGGKTVGEIQENLDIANSTLSHHLDKLKREGLVRTEKDKQWIWYFANVEAMTELLDFIYADCCGGTKKLVMPKKMMPDCCS